MPYTQVANLDFADIKSALIEYMRANTDFTDYDFQGSVLSNLLDVLAYNTYYTAFNANMVVNELFLDSATLRDNVVALAKQIGYRPRSTTAPRARVNFELTYSGNLNPPPKTILMRKGTGFVTSFDSNLYQYVIIDDQEAPLTGGVANFDNLDIYEGTLVTNYYTVNTALQSQRFLISNAGADISTLRVKVYQAQGNTTHETYESAENILSLSKTSKVFYVEEIEDQQYEIFFGDGVYGKKLENGNYVEISYLITSAGATNGASTFTYAGIVTDKATGNTLTYDTAVTLVEASNGGADAESIASIKNSAVKAFSAQDRAVTAGDYESIVRKLYPAISDIITFGGEEDDPPEFGKVKVAIKPQNATSLSQVTKLDLEKKLRKYTVASITPQIIDPSILYVELTSRIGYDTAKTTLTTAEIQTKATTAVQEYIDSSQTEKFNGKFRHSKFAAVIDGSDASITSNLTEVTLRKDFYPTLNSSFYYELCFVNEFKDSCDDPVMKSTGFIVSEYPAFTVYLEDDTNGKIDLYRLNPLTSEKIYVKKGVGDINYKKGEIKLYDLTVIQGSFSDNKIEVRVEPASRDVNAVREVYLDVDLSNSNFGAYPE